MDLTLPGFAICIAAISLCLTGSIVSNNTGDQAVGAAPHLIFGCLCGDPRLLFLLCPRLRLHLLTVLAPLLARCSNLQLFLLPRSARRFGGFHTGAVILQQRSFRSERGSPAIGDVINLGVSQVFILFGKDSVGLKAASRCCRDIEQPPWRLYRLTGQFVVPEEMTAAGLRASTSRFLAPLTRARAQE